MGLALAFCCAGPVIVTGAAAGSAATGALTLGSSLWLVWPIAVVSGLAALWAYRLAVSPSATPGEWNGHRRRRYRPLIPADGSARSTWQAGQDAFRDLLPAGGRSC
jgi:hypothetical protein